MIDPQAAATSGASLVLAFGLLLVFTTPQWVLLLWVARSPHRLRASSRSTSLKLLPAMAWIAAVAVGAIGSIWVNDALIGRERAELYDLVNLGAIVQLFLLSFAGLFVASRRKAARGPTASPPRRKPSPRAISVVLVAWAVAAGVAVALALGPLRGRPAEKHAWLALAVALAVITTLIVLLARAIREARRTG